MADFETRREAAFLEFSTAFEKEGLGKAPEGLINMLKQYSIKPSETAEAMRYRIYRRLWAIMWHGCNIGRGKTQNQPTYVYPKELKKVVRAIIPGNLKDRSDPTGVNVFNITLAHLKEAKWPAPKKTTR